MSINHIRLKNFKCFKGLDLTLPKITLLTGANSSGKSSVLYGLLAPFQSNEFPLYLSPNGKYVNMGDFLEMSFGNSQENEIGVDFSVQNHRGEVSHFRSGWIIDPINNLPKLNNLDVATVDFSFAINKLTSPVYGKKDLKIRNALQETFKFIETVDDKLNFISSFRHHPERTYYQKAKSDNKVGRFGEGYIDQILEWQDRDTSKFRQLNAIMNDLRLVNAITTQKLTGGRFELRVQVQEEGAWCSLADVGFGISQFLPIIVADLQLHTDSTLLVAQPEIHLHPSVQASLGDYLVGQANHTNKQYIIETHSEYLLNRIRLAIVKGEIEPSEVAIYYFTNSIDGSTTYPVEFTQDGQILGAPSQFFDTYMIDTMDIALHA